MRPSYRAMLVKAKPWLIGGTILGLLAWNMKQCSSIDKEHDMNDRQNEKIAQVDTVARENRSYLNQLIDAIGRVDAKADDNSQRIDGLETSVSSVKDSVDSLSVRVAKIKPCPCTKKTKKTPAKAQKRKKYATSGKRTSVQQSGTNNTVNINNGTVNNYYNAPAPEKKREPRCVYSSATIEVEHIVVVSRGNCR